MISSAQTDAAQMGDLAEALGKASVAYNEARSQATMHKVEVLDVAKAALDDAHDQAAMEGLLAGATDGKNQAERDMRLASWLRDHDQYKAAKAALQTATLRQAALDDQAERCEQDFKALTYELRALESATTLTVAAMEMQMQINTRRENHE